MTPSEVGAYLSRIGLAEAPPPTLAGLARLQEAHMLAVPFENLSIVAGHGVDLSADALFEKVVAGRRGGFCFELNGLYGLLLDALGFERRPVSARVWYRGPTGTPGLTHTLNIVTLPDGEVMSDVGFGGVTARVPVPLGDEVRLTDGDGEVALIRDAAFGYRLRRKTPEGWVEQFSTDAVRAYPADMAIGSHYASTHPDSQFVNTPLAGLFTPEGRDTLVGRLLRVRTGWDVAESEVGGADAYARVLRDRFGLGLGGDLAAVYEASGA